MTVNMKVWLRASCMLAILAAFLSAPVMAQPPGGGFGGGGQGRGGGFGFGGGFGMFGGGGGFMMLLGNDDVKKELQLLDDQVSQITAIQAEMGEEMRPAFGQMQTDREGATAKITEIRKKAEEKVAKVLDEEQLKRVKEIEFQQLVNRGMGVASGLTSDEVVADLGLSKEQVESLTAAQKEADEEYRKKVSAARAEALEKLIASLPAEQQAKFKEKYGKPFEMRFGGFGPGGAGRGGAGGPGGGPGGGGRGNRGNRGGGGPNL